MSGLKAVLALTGFCLGCRQYALNWWRPAQFDRLVGNPAPAPRA